ncbi:MAG TPA: hypothetical protein VFJ68_10130 [Casimicrobiaceae bacterium]|nr:hypothetical protein [Casimicrobiaceae bacterium]
MTVAEPTAIDGFWFVNSAVKMSFGPAQRTVSPFGANASLKPWTWASTPVAGKFGGPEKS